MINIKRYLEGSLHVWKMSKAASNYGPMKKWYEWQLENLKTCKVVEYNAKLKFKPKLKECYNNAWWMSMYHGATYVEGYIVSTPGLPLMHAWNKINGKYYDITMQFLHKEIGKEYGVLMELTQEEVHLYSSQHKTTGDYMRHYYMEQLKNEHIKYDR